MPQFEVFIPAKPGTENESVMVEVEASSWLLALRTGMNQIGEQGDSLSSIMCDNRPDGTIVVKDPTSRRMFRIREMTGEAAVPDPELVRRAKEEAEAARRAAEEADARRKEAEKLLQQKIEFERQAAEEARIRHEMALKAKQEQQEKEETEKQAKAEEEKRISQKAAKAAMERAVAEKELKAHAQRFRTAQLKAAELSAGSSKEIRISTKMMQADEIKAELGEDVDEAETLDVDSILADLFMETMTIVDFQDEKSASEFILGLAMNSIKAEAGSVILSDINSALSDLYFIAAHGDVANQLSDIRIPRGQGIVGFSVQIGTTLSVSDANNNPNFDKTVQEKTGYKTRSVLCVPIQGNETTYGAIELINKVDSNKWSIGEVNVVQFLAQKIGEHLDILHSQVEL